MIATQVNGAVKTVSPSARHLEHVLVSENRLSSVANAIIAAGSLRQGVSVEEEKQRVSETERNAISNVISEDSRTQFRTSKYNSISSSLPNNTIAP